MADALIVFNDVKDWFPPVVVQKDLITVPRINIDLRIPYPDGVLAKGQEYIKKLFNPKFDAEFPKLSKAAFSKMQKLIDAFQDKVEKAKKAKDAKVLNKAALEKDLAALNTGLEFCCDQWKKDVDKLASKSFDDALAKWDSETKAKIKRAKTKVIVKAVVLAAILLAAGAIAIVATVASGGSTAVLVPAIIAAAAAACVSVVKLHREMTSGFAARAKLCDDKVKEVKADLAAIDKALNVLTNPTVDKVGVKQRFKVGWSLLEKHVGQLEKFHRDLAVQIADIKKKLATHEAILEKAKDDPKSGPVKASIELLKRQLENLEKRLKDLSGLEALCAESLAVINAGIEKGQVPKYEKLRKVVDALGQTTDFFSSILDLGSKVSSSASSYEKALKH